jgi:ATP-dependent DNA helicase DinG
MIKPAEYSIEQRWPPENTANDNDFTGIACDEPFCDDENSAASAAEILGRTEKFFLKDSPLAEAEKYGGRAYEYRPQQAEMARRTAEALIERRNLCAEAPTGIGKSFAYLVPLIYYSQTQDRPVLISTETINLQEQLIDKDIPILAKLTGIQFKAALAKGRGNYLCLRRLAMASGDRQDELIPLASLALDIQRVAKWADATKDGNRDDMDLRIDPSSWGYVCCEAGNCAGPRCGFFKSCFYWRARLEWEKADIIVANHALFFTDLKMKQDENLENTLLPPYSAVVIDEAHTLENNAAEYLGLRVNSAGLHSFLNRLFNPENGKGLLVKSGPEAMELRSRIADIKRDSAAFFSMAEQFLLEKQDSARRFLKPALIPDLLSRPLGNMRNMLAEFIKAQDDKDLKTELESQLMRCDAYIDGISDFTQMAYPEHVYWVEEDKVGVSLRAAPLNVAAILETILFAKTFPVILTSATLTVKNSFDYYRSRVGYGRGAELRLDSPFSNDRVKLFISRNMPEPTDQTYKDALLREIPKFLMMTHGKAFVLFTSHQLLKYCAENLKDFFEDNNITLLTQGESMTRSTMLKEFKNDINSVIFGADSFWTGVDVPGEALSNVIVTKFPFAVPSHPLIEARCEKIEASGASSFMGYSLPEAVLKFRQGAGRLIRSKHDTGIIVILDRRVFSKRYGQYFLNSLPPYPVHYV